MRNFIFTSKSQLLTVCIVGLLIINSGVFARPDSYTDIEIPEIRWEPAEYREFELKNGIAGLVVEDNEVPLVYFDISFPAYPDPEDKVGLADLTSWVLRNGGSTNIPSDSLNDILEFKAAYLSVYADQEQFGFAGYGHKDDVELLLSLVRDLIEKPAFPDQIISIKKGDMLEQIRRRYDSPQGIGYRELNKLLYPKHPWGRETSVESVSSVTRDDLLSYHQKVLQAEGVVIGFSGDISLKTAKKLSDKYLKNLKKNKSGAPGLPPVLPSAQPGIYYVYKDVEQAFILMGEQAIDYSDPRRPISEIGNYILGGGGFQSILMKRIRNQEGLTYGIGSRMSTPVMGKGSFRIMASTRLDQSGRTLALTDELLRKYLNDGPGEEEFNNAKQAFVNSYVWDFDDSAKILNRLVYLKWCGLPLDMPQRDLQAYQEMTAEQLRQVMSEIIDPDKMIVVIVGDRSKMDRPLEDFGTVYEIKIDN